MTYVLTFAASSFIVVLAGSALVRTRMPSRM